MLTPGQSVDRYEVLRPLGEGGMAAVYLVKHTQLQSLHALKVLTLDRPGLRERLLQEGRVQAALKHDCAVTVTDVIDVQGAPGLIMEYVEGPTLEDWLRDEPPLDERLVLFEQVVGAVAAAHAMGLVHRDLKPANILIERREAGDRAKVTDFGIAKALAEDQSAGKTRSGTAMGTPAYMAPEQMRDASTVDHRADIWALGAILYELVTGEVALGQGTLVETWEKAKNADFPSVRKRVPGVAPAVAATIEGALVPDPNARIASCAELLSTLGTGEQVPAPSSLPTTVGESTRPSRLPWIAGGAVGALLIAGGALAAVLVLGAALSGSGEAEDCSPGWFGTVGYARASAIFRWREGDLWRLPRRVGVYADTETEGGEALCYLPAGSEVQVLDPPMRKDRRTWIRVGARSFSLPEEE